MFLVNYAGCVSCKSFFKLFKVCEEVPSFQLYPSFQLDLKKRALKRFQQAARKVHTHHKSLWGTCTNADMREHFCRCTNTYMHTSAAHLACPSGGRSRPCSCVPWAQPGMNSSHYTVCLIFFTVSFSRYGLFQEVNTHTQPQYLTFSRIYGKSFSSIDRKLDLNMNI